REGRATRQGPRTVRRNGARRDRPDGGGRMMLEHALKYAADGLAVFPLVPRTKRPATAHGKDDATLGADQIRAWWTATPDANIAARPPEGVVVLDVDPRHGGTLEA